jgi:hypothetical protein
VQSLLLDLPQDLSCSCVRKPHSLILLLLRSRNRTLANKRTQHNSLTEHAANKHSKTLTECFPNFTA